MSVDVLATMPRRDVIDMVAEEWAERRDLRLVVTSRRCAGYRVDTAGEPCSVISVSDPLPVHEPVRWRPMFYLREVLPLSFVDIDATRVADADLDDAENDWERPWRELLMTDSDGLAIWEWLASVKEKLLIVHCFAGVSRSPSIAMAIADCLHVPRSSIQWNEDDDPTAEAPNRHVYDCVRRGFVKWKRKVA